MIRKRRRICKIILDFQQVAELSRSASAGRLERLVVHFWTMFLIHNLILKFLRAHAGFLAEQAGNIGDIFLWGIK